MLKRPITYEDLDGETVTETFYFNLTRTELVEINVEHKGGMQDFLQKMVKAEDQKSLFGEIKKIILMSYGVKSDDGRRFVKSQELRDEFVQTNAFDALFMELQTDDAAAATFIKGIMPKQIQIESDKLDAMSKGIMPALPVKE